MQKNNNSCAGSTHLATFFEFFSESKNVGRSLTSQDPDSPPAVLDNTPGEVLSDVPILEEPVPEESQYDTVELSTSAEDQTPAISSPLSPGITSDEVHEEDMMEENQELP